MKSRDSTISWTVILVSGLAVGATLGLVVKNRAGSRNQFEVSNGPSPVSTSRTQADPDALFPGRLVLRRTTAEDLKRIEDKEQVTELFLDAPQLDSSQYGGLAEFPRLQHLRVRAGKVDDEALRQIARLSKLRQLNLPRAQFTDAGLASLASLDQLELFRFGSHHVTDEGVNYLAALPNLRFLHVIDTPITDRGLGYLHCAEQLESFYLDGSEITDLGIEAFFRALPDVHFHIDQVHDDRDPRRH